MGTVAIAKGFEKVLDLGVDGGIRERRVPSAPYAADRAQRMVLIDPSATDAAIDAQIEHFLEDLSADRLTVTHGTEAQSGSDYRLVMLNYDMNLVIPTLVGATVSIGAVSRILLH